MAELLYADDLSILAELLYADDLSILVELLYADGLSILVEKELQRRLVEWQEAQRRSRGHGMHTRSSSIS